MGHRTVFLVLSISIGFGRVPALPVYPSIPRPSTYPPLLSPSPTPPIYGSVPPSPSLLPSPSPSPLPSAVPSTSPPPTQSPSPYPLTPLPSPSLPYQPTASFTGSARFLGPAVSCNGFVMDGYGSYTMTTSTDGAFTAAFTPSALQVFAIVTISDSCHDSFTGLPLPYSITGTVYRPPGLAPIAVVTPVTRIAQYMPTSNDDSVKLPYGYFGVDTTSALSGGLDALRSSSTVSRRTGVRMLFADAAVSSLVFIAQAALAAFSTSTLPGCPTSDARFAAVQTALAARIAQGVGTTLDLTSTSLLPAVLKGAANHCGANTTTVMATAQVAKLQLSAAVLYQTAAAELSLDTERIAELTALPHEALSAASRISYVVQAKGPAALSSLSSNSQAVDQLLSGWAAQLEAAPVRMDAMATFLGISAPMSGPVRLSVRSTGSLTGCQLLVRDVLKYSTTTAVTDTKGTAVLQDMIGALVTVPTGCHDAVLSTSMHAVNNTFTFTALLPLAVSSAVVDVMASLTTQVAFVRAGAATWSPHHITVADFAFVYTYFSVGKKGEADALPDGTDFVRQNWPATAVVGVRSYLLSLRVLSAVAPASTFLSGLLGASYTVDRVAQSLVTMIAKDLVAASLRVDNSDYLFRMMLGYYQMHSGTSAVALYSRRRRNLQALSLDQLTTLIQTVASTVAQSTAMLVQLDQQVKAAAAAGTPIDPLVVYQGAAQISSVQQNAMMTAISALASAAASGEYAAVQTLSTAFASDFSGSSLRAQVQSAVVDTSLMSTNSTTTNNSGADQGNDDKGKVALIIGCTIGVIGGLALIAAAVLVTIKLRRHRAQTVSPRENAEFDAARQLRSNP